MLNKDPVPLGSRSPGYHKPCVNPWLYKILNRNPEHHYLMIPDAKAHEVIADNLDDDTILLTCGPPCNVGKLLENHPDKELSLWLAQGGFAGDNVVAEEHRLEKFKGKITCPTFNFNGAVKESLAALASPKIKNRRLISKNVCHGVIFDQKVYDANRNSGMRLINDFMYKYLRKNPKGKKFHDLLAAATIIDPSICEYKEVEVYRNKGEWGSKLKANTNTLISVAVDETRFWDVFFLRTLV